MGLEKETFQDSQVASPQPSSSQRTPFTTHGFRGEAGCTQSQLEPLPTCV